MLTPLLALIFGTAGPDNLTGTPQADTIRSGAPVFTALDSGPDTVAGGDGDDGIRLYGGGDTGQGGAGDDTILGGSGTDTLDGGDGADRLEGGLAYDDLTGGPGNDILLGGDFNDVLRGGPGDDTIEGGSAVEYAVSGGPGDDMLTARVIAGWLDGGTGADVLRTPEGLGKNRFGFRTFDGANAFGTGTNTTTLPDFRRGTDELFFVGAHYLDGTPVATLDTNGDGKLSTGDKGWSVLPTAKPVLRFRGWNSTLLIPGLTFIEAQDVSVQ